MNEFLVALRTVHYASAMLLLGEAVFAFGIAGPSFRRAFGGDGAGDRDAFGQRFSSVARWSLIASIASAVAWFAAQVPIMSGLPPAEALTRETLGLALHGTAFGHIFTVRAGLALALAAVLIAMRRTADGARRSGFLVVLVVLAAAYLGSLAWTGHALAGGEAEDTIRIVADVAHLLAAGVWLGALPALVFVLARVRAPDVAADAARRFSTLGFASVGVLTASGVVNAWYQVGGVPDLVGTGYGRLLIAKLALFAAMLALAAVNRGLAAPPRSGAGPQRLRLLRRNAMLEIALGIGVIAIVGVLGITVPAIHQPAIWPFARTLSLDPIRQSAWLQLVVVAAGSIACIAAVIFVAGALRRPPRISLIGGACVAVPGAVLAYLLAVPSYPTTYLVSPVPYSADAIAAGSILYAEHCSACHGRSGRDGELNDRVPLRREGDLFWSIAHGIPGTPMPGFGSRIGERAIWDLVQFLDAQTAAQNALQLSDRIRPSRPVPAPDFTFELREKPQQTLRQARANRVTLLVFYTMPSSLPRLLQLATLERTYEAAGARIIALPMPASSAATALDLRGEGESMLALAGPAVAATYLMFARQSHGGAGGVGVGDVDPGTAGATEEGPPAHLEYLVDRFGFLRLRWIGVPAATAERSGATLRQIEGLANEQPPAPVQWGHRH